MSEDNKGETLYEDDVVNVVLPEKPAAKGHLKIISKKKYKAMADVPEKDIEHLFYAASFTATALFENLGAQGTNIIADTGNIYTDDEGSVVIDVLARSEGDGLNFQWQPQKLEDADMKGSQDKIKDKADFIGVEKKEEVKEDKIEEKNAEVIESSISDESDDGEKEDNYLVKQVKRLP